VHLIYPSGTVGRPAGADRDLQIARHSLSGCAGSRTAILLINVPIGGQHANKVVLGFIMDGGQAGVILHYFIIQCAGAGIGDDCRIHLAGGGIPIRIPC
jgi:hypothetical protein